MGKKKAKKGDPTFDDDFPDTESSVVSDTQQADTPTQPKPAKKAKGKKGKRGGADWDSEEEDQKAPAPVSPPPAKSRASVPKPTSTFAALGSEDEAASDASAGHDKPSAAAFSALDEEADEEHETVAATTAGSQQVCVSMQRLVCILTSTHTACSVVEALALQDTLRVAEIVKASKHPSSIKLKVCTVSVGLDVFQVRQSSSLRFPLPEPCRGLAAWRQARICGVRDHPGLLDCSVGRHEVAAGCHQCLHCEEGDARRIRGSPPLSHAQLSSLDCDLAWLHKHARSRASLQLTSWTRAGGGVQNTWQPDADHCTGCAGRRVLWHAVLRIRSWLG